MRTALSYELSSWQQSWHGIHVALIQIKISQERGAMGEQMDTRSRLPGTIFQFMVRTTASLTWCIYSNWHKYVQQMFLKGARSKICLCITLLRALKGHIRITSELIGDQKRRNKVEFRKLSRQRSWAQHHNMIRDPAKRTDFDLLVTIRRNRMRTLATWYQCGN